MTRRVVAKTQAAEMAATPSPTGKPSGRRGGYHHGDLRNALVQATLQLLETTGPRDLTLADAARQVGVSVAAPYRHFADKAALLAAAAGEAFQAFRLELERLSGEGDPIEQLAAMTAAYVRMARKQPGRFALMNEVMLNQEADEALGEASDEAFVPVVTLCARLLDRPGEGSCQDPVVLRLARQIWYIAHGAALLGRRADLPEENADRLAADTVRTLLR